MKLTDIISRFDPADKEIRRPFIIAEAGVNHEGSIETAKRLIAEAAEGGAHAIKFQSYKASTLASKYSPAYWDTTREPTQSQFELFKKHDKFWKKEFELLKRTCDEVGIEFMSTPFDLESADFLDPLMDVYKISSSDLSNFPFIEHICGKRKPILLSTGASYMWEVHEVVELIGSYGNSLSLLHCILNYPTPDESAHLAMIPDLRRHFPNIPLGYSDHTLPGDMENLVAAWLLGARIIEKHFTYDKTLPGNDHYHAMDLADLNHLTKRLARFAKVLGSGSKTCLPEEGPARQNARRSLVACKDIPAGKTIEVTDLTWKRPAHGIAPKHIHDVVGKTAADNIRMDEIITWMRIK